MTAARPCSHPAHRHRCCRRAPRAAPGPRREVLPGAGPRPHRRQDRKGFLARAGPTPAARRAAAERGPPHAARWSRRSGNTRCPACPRMSSPPRCCRPRFRRVRLQAPARNARAHASGPRACPFRAEPTGSAGDTRPSAEPGPRAGIAPATARRAPPHHGRRCGDSLGTSRARSPVHTSAG